MPRSKTLASLAALLSPALSAQTSFTEQTAAAGIDHTYQPGVFSNANYAGGGATGDFDADGKPDLFLLSGRDANQSDSLYMNQGDGTFTESSAAWGVTQVHNGKGISVADYDDDGDVDVYITSAGFAGGGQIGQHMLLQNTGSSFTDVAATAGVQFTTTTGQGEDGWGSAFGDYDLDGDLDMCVGGFAPANSGTKLFQNQGDGTFVDIGDSIDLFGGTTIQMKVFAPRFADMDGDGYPELLLAADFGTSAYFRNNTDGTFTDVTVAAGVGQDENGMGQTVDDFNGDGLLDWYVTSVYLPVVGWSGNKLYINQGNHSYVNISETAGVVDGGYGWAPISADLDHDGFLDIASCDGAVGTWGMSPAHLWMSDGAGAYTSEAASSGFVHTGLSRGLIDFDYDGDGDMDLMLLARDAPAVLFRNEAVTPGSSTGSWLRVFLDTTNDPTLAPAGYGSIVRATVGGTTLMRAVLGGDNFLSQSELVAHFGLGTATTVDTLEVTWSNGLVTSLTNVPVDQELTLEPPSPWTLVGGSSPGTLGVPDLTVKGPLLPGKPVVFEIENLVPASFGVYIAGLSPLSLPFAGGVMVPALDVLVGLAADGSGADSLQIPWPAGAPPGLPVWVQCWILDPGAVAGLASSAGFLGTGN